MDNKRFKEPKITINKVYTKVGDKGETSLVGGIKVLKSSLRVSSYGNVDELNACIGSCISFIHDHFNENNDLIKFSSILNDIQHELFNLGNMLATPEDKIAENMPSVNEKTLNLLENNIDFYNDQLNSLKSFVLPGGHELNSRLHIARTVCRRCERVVVELSKKEKINELILSYLNRLSDMLFVSSRWVNHLLNVKEVTWNPNYGK